MISVFQNQVFRRFAALAGGSVAGQAIMLVALPIATQIYTPAQFGVLATFSSIVMVILPAACLRFDLAIPIPEDDSEALGLVVLAFFSATVSSLLVVLALRFSSKLWGADIQQVIDLYLWLVAIALWSAAVFSLVQYWAIRLQRFKALALSHASRGLAGATAQIGLGLAGAGTIGLLLGQSIYMGLGAFVLAAGVLSLKLPTLMKLRAGSVVLTARKYWRFPVFSTPEALLGSASAYLPLLLIVAFLGVQEGGLFYVAQRLTSIPVGLIGGNLSRVYLGEAPLHARKGQLFSFTRKIMLLLFFGALPFAIAGMLFSEVISRALLGAEWTGSARYLTILIPAALLQFSVVPVSTVLHVRSRQFIAMLLQLSGFGFRVGSILFCQVTGLIDPVLGFAVGSAVHYAIHAMVALLIARD